MEVARIGPAAGRPVLLVHGTPNDSSPWRRLVERRPDDVCVWLVDLADHSKSSPGTTLDDLERDLTTLVARETSRRWTLVGHSFGAYLCARILGEVAPLVEHAVLVGGMAGVPSEMVAGFSTMARDVEDGRLTTRALLSDWIDASMGPHAPADAAEELRRALFAWPEDRIVRSLRRLAELDRAERRVRPYAVPTTVLHARDDVASPVALGIELASLGENAELVVLPRGGHYLQISDCARVAKVAFGR